MSGGCKIGAMSLDQSFQQFEADHRAMGFDEVIERRWPALVELTRHVHDFEAKALMVAGEMWLSVEAETHHLQAGNTSSWKHDCPMPNVTVASERPIGLPGVARQPGRVRRSIYVKPNPPAERRH